MHSGADPGYAITLFRLIGFIVLMRLPAGPATWLSIRSRAWFDCVLTGLWQAISPLLLPRDPL